MHPGTLMGDPAARMEQSLLGDVFHERDAFLYQVSKLSPLSPHEERLAAKRALVHLLAQASNLQEANATKITTALQKHMHLLHTSEASFVRTMPGPASSAQCSEALVVEKAPMPMELEAVASKTVLAEGIPKKARKFSALGTTSADFTALCEDPTMIDAVDSTMGLWSDPGNITTALHRLFCSNQAKLTGKEWTLSNVSSVLVSLVTMQRNSSVHYLVDYSDAKERASIALQVMLYLQKRNFVTVAPVTKKGNATVEIKIVPSEADPNIPLIAKSALVVSKGWSEFDINACICNYAKEKYGRKNKKGK